MTNKPAPTSVRLPPDLKQAAERAAEADSRTVSSLIEKLLTDYCRRRGFLTRGRA